MNVLEKMRSASKAYPKTDVRSLLHIDHERIALEHHIQEEESALFEQLGEHLADEDRTRMAGHFQKGEDKLLAPATKRAYSTNPQATVT